MEENQVSDLQEVIDTVESADSDNERTTETSEIPDSSENTAVETSGEVSKDTRDDSILAAVSELSDRVEQMNQLFIQKIQHTAHEEKIVDQMHAELQKYKDDMYAQLIRPVLLDIIEIRDSIKRVSASFAAKPEEKQMVPLETFHGYTLDIRDVLEKNNITIYDSREGEEFNPLKQRVIKKVTTPVEQLHGKIAESLSSGYDYMGKTISPEKVVVYIYQKPENTEEENKNG